MRLAFCFLLLASIAPAEPDWPAVEQHAIALLQHYVRIRSINPPADTRETAELLKAEFSAAGLAPILYDAGNGHINLTVRLAGRDRSKRPLLLLNHMDVVPVDPTQWKEDPFGAEIKGGMLWGRGSLDMKSTAVVQLTAMILLKQQGIIPSRDILFLADCDEESDGRNGAGWMIHNHWNELNPEYVLDEGGLGSADLFATGKTVFGVSVGDKQVTWIKLRARGTAGHGSQPIPNNANDILLAAIEKARQIPPSKKPDPVVEAMRSAVGEFAPNKFTNAIQQNTVSLTTLRSGVGDPPKVNVIPSIAEATLDCRLLPGQNAEEFVSEMKARVNDPRVTFELLSEPADPGPSRTDTPLYAAVKKAILSQHPEAIVTPIIIPYGTDNQKFRLKGAIGYGIMPFLLDADNVATFHSDSERIPIAEVKKALRIYYDILRSDF
jgi:acetylornithine deacetylase/succinyl-diaminopimelate desuccinylase-like protein